MKLSALSLALLIAAFTSTAGLVRAEASPRLVIPVLVPDETCRVDGVLDDEPWSAETRGWCPHPYSGLSEWLVSRDLAVSVSGDRPSAVPLTPQDGDEGGILATEPESAGALPGREKPKHVPDPEASPEIVEEAVPTALPIPTAAPTAVPVPTPVPTPAPPRQPIPSGLTSSSPNVLYLYYEVNGSTYVDVQEQASNSGPVDGRGEHWAGTTNWSMSWKAKAMPDGRLADVEVNYSAKITLPRWTPPAEADESDVQQWSTYVDQLTRHENGHVDILTTNIPQVVGALKAANKGNVQAVFDSEFRRISQKQEEYDAATNHGLN